MIATYLDSVLSTGREGWSEGADRDFAELIRNVTCPHVVIDFQRKRIPVDHLALSQLFVLAGKISALGGTAWLCGLDEPLMAMVSIMHLENHFRIVSDRAEAILESDRTHTHRPATDSSA